MWRRHRGEIVFKNEQMFANDFIKGTPDLLIEESKYQGLILAAGIRSLVPWYINATPEGIWGFNLSTIPQPKWQDKWLPITTEFANRTSRTKLVGFLKLEDGILF